MSDNCTRHSPTQRNTPPHVIQPMLLNTNRRKLEQSARAEARCTLKARYMHHRTIDHLVEAMTRNIECTGSVARAAGARRATVSDRTSETKDHSKRRGFDAGVFVGFHILYSRCIWGERADSASKLWLSMPIVNAGARSFRNPKATGAPRLR
jgi:hypothetical protein